MDNHDEKNKLWLKKEGRSAQLEQGIISPDHERPNDSTLAEWFRYCRRSGLHEQGKLLYEKSGLNWTILRKTPWLMSKRITRYACEC